MGERVAVIMAGGSGERFWPLSSPDRPKQLLRLTDPGHTMLEEAVLRIEPLVARDRIFISTGLQIEAPIRHARLLDEENILVEPERRNTLGALVWVSACLLARFGPEATVCVLTADHKIEEEEAFRETVALAMAAAEQNDALVTIGILPTRPETGFGYIETEEGDVAPPRRSKGFREKPDLATAMRFVQKGNFLWNSGMFFWRLSTFLTQLAHAMPEAAGICRQIAGQLAASDAAGAAEAFARLPNISVDYALMEKARSVLVIPASFRWDDVGSWDALERTMPLDASLNVTEGRVVAEEARGCILYNDSPDVTVAVYGIHDLVVVLTDKALLIVPKEHAQQVRQLAQKVKG